MKFQGSDHYVATADLMLAVNAAITGLQRTAALDEHEQLTPLGTPKDF